MYKVLNRNLAVFLVAACLVFASACGSSSGPSDTTGAKLRITYFPGIASGVPVLAAEKSGAFEKHGLDVDLITVKTGPDASSTVAGGHADVMVQDHSNAFLLQANGHDPVVLIGNERTAVNGVIIRKGYGNSDATGYPASIEPLKGANFGVVVRGGALENIARGIISDAGLNPDKDVEFAAVGLAPTAVPALQHGDVDAYLGQEPMMTRATEEGWGRVVVDLRKGEGPANMSPWQSTGMVALRGWAEKNKDTVAKFQEAMRDAQTWMQDSANHDALVEIVAKQMGVDDALAEKVTANNMQTWGAAVEPAAIQNVADFALRNGIIKKAVEVSSYIFAGATDK